MMVRVVQHLNLAELRSALEGGRDRTTARHLLTILLLAEGHTIAETARRVGFATRWVEEILSRYNERGPQALGDQRRANGAQPRLLTPQLLERLRLRLVDPPEDGGAWTSRKVAVLIAEEIGRPHVAPQRGWEALRALDRLAEKDVPPAQGAADDRDPRPGASDPDGPEVPAPGPADKPGRRS
jgi:transposase